MQYTVGNEKAVVAVSDEIGADDGNDQPQGIDGFAAIECDDRECRCSKDRNQGPNKMAFDISSVPTLFR